MEMSKLVGPDFHQRKILRDLAVGVPKKLVDVKGEPHIKVIP